MKKIWMILLLSICAVNASPQHVSVNHISPRLTAHQPDSDKLKVLKKIAGQYQYTDSAKAFYYARQGLSLALKDRYAQDVWNFYQLLGNLSRLKNNYRQAFYFFGKELAASQQNHNLSQIVMSYLDLGLAYQAESKFTDAQTNFLKALGVSENNPNHPSIGLIYEDIATVYDNENQLDKASEYVQKAINFGDKKDTVAQEKAFELKGVIEYERGHSELARSFHQRALRLYQLQKDSIGEATMYMQIASTYDRTYLNAQKCLEYGFKSKAICDKTNPGSVYALYNLDNLAMAYWNMVKYLDTMPHIKNRLILQRSLATKAQHSFEDAYRLSKKYSNSIAALFALDKLSKVESFQGNNDQAYQHMRLYNTIHDSVYSQQNINKIAELENQRAIDLRDKQLQIRKLQLANQHKQTILLIGSLAIVVCIALLIYLRSRNRKRVNQKLLMLNKELDTANSVKNKFFGILNHDLKKPISDLVTLRRLQQFEPDLISEASREKYEEQFTSSAEHLLNTMDDLLLWSKGQMENFTPQYRDVSIKLLFDYIKSTFENSEIAIVFKQDQDFTLFTDEHYLKTIMLNLTNNAAHALSKTDLPLIEWNSWQDGHNVYLTITDNGLGADEQTLRPLYDETAAMGIKNGLGLHIIRDLAKAIDCKIEVDANRPTGIKISIKFKHTR